MSIGKKLKRIFGNLKKFVNTNMSDNSIFKITEIPELNQSHCKIKDPEKVENILNAFLIGGSKRIQVVTDFDFTITKQHCASGKKILSSFGLFSLCKSLPRGVLDEDRLLCQKYRPIEIDPNLPKEVKTVYMIEWWEKSSDLLSGFPLDLNEIDEVTEQYKDTLRDYTHELFAKLDELNVPCLVFSAGLGDCVKSLLKNANVMHPNVQVISNFLVLNNGMLNGLKRPLIHTLNKNETALKGTEYYNLVHDKDHIILMGDSLGDSTMADGMPLQSMVLKIGFLYEHAEERLEKYMDTFDIVLIDDQTMTVPRAIIQLIETNSIRLE